MTEKITGNCQQAVPAPSTRAMTIPALYRACLPSLLPQPQVAPLALPMQGVFRIQAAGLRPQTMANLALRHRLPFTPDIALSLVIVVALGAGYAPGFVHPVAELHRRLNLRTRHRDFQEAHRRGLGERPALGS